MTNAIRVLEPGIYLVPSSSLICLRLCSTRWVRTANYQGYGWQHASTEDPGVQHIRPFRINYSWRWFYWVVYRRNGTRQNQTKGYVPHGRQGLYMLQLSKFTIDPPTVRPLDTWQAAFMQIRLACLHLNTNRRCHQLVRLRHCSPQ